MLLQFLFYTTDVPSNTRKVKILNIKYLHKHVLIITLTDTIAGSSHKIPSFIAEFRILFQNVSIGQTNFRRVSQPLKPYDPPLLCQISLSQ